MPDNNQPDPTSAPPSDAHMFASGDIVTDTETRNVYRIKRFMGEGAFGEVYAAVNKLGGEIVVKVLKPKYNGDHEVVQRFLKESRAAAAISSPHVVQVFDAGTTADGFHFLVMEMLEGCTLAKYLDTKWGKGEHVSEREVLHIMLGICDGLRAVHVVGIIHRDLKPENIFLVDQRGPPLVKIMDFGIAHVDDPENSRLTRDGNMGTPNYMSPEQIEHPPLVDHRTDVYAVGIMLYEALETRMPHERPTAASTMVAVLRDEPRPMDTASPELQTIIRKAMAKAADERFQNVLDLADALETYGRQHSLLPEQTVVTRPSLADEPTVVLEIPRRAQVPTALEHSDIKKAPPRGRTWRSAGAIGVSVLLLIMIVMASWKRHATRVPTASGHQTPVLAPTAAPPPVLVRNPAPSPAPRPRIVAPVAPVITNPAPPTPPPPHVGRRHRHRQTPAVTPVVGRCSSDPVTGENICD